MTRKHTRRRVIVPLPPRGLRPKLGSDQLRDLAICHLQHLDAIACGDATVDTLWQVMAAALTWSKVAELLGAGVPEITEQLQLCTSLVERFERTGRVAFNGPEYQRAKAGVDVMDALAEATDRHTAVIAAEWSEARVNQAEAAWRDRAGTEKATA